MANDQLRCLVLSNLTDVKSVMLSPQSVEIVRWLKVSPMTSTHLAKVLGININNASNRLQKLHKQGYLERSVDKSSSGGIEYIYQTRELFFDYL